MVSTGYMETIRQHGEEWWLRKHQSNYNC